KPWLREARRLESDKQRDWFFWRQKRGVVVAGRMSAEEGKKVAQCTDNLDDALLLPAFDQAVSINRSQDDHSHGLGTLELKFRY
ncbi:hypothetical protein MJM95_30955, partial [Salmonella enterica subsp. enterica serovar Anatum]|nr:hypothetical protein [Salmonella enterica subsp. enterica serovar Anatum]